MQVCVADLVTCKQSESSIWNLNSMFSFLQSLTTPGIPPKTKKQKKKPKKKKKKKHVSVLANIGFEAADKFVSNFIPKLYVTKM